MESPPEPREADPSARTYSQVVFTDIPHSYPPSTAVTCCYTLTAGFQPSPRDWVGIFKVGWSTTKDYHTFVWVDHCQGGQQSENRQSVFKDYYLPKDEIEFYQFCYIDSAGQVRGASTPFSFKASVEQSSESCPDDDLLVITTQEQVEQSVREKAELQKELDQTREENETLKRVLHKEQQEATSLKGQYEQKEKEKAQLVKELDQTKEQNGDLQSIIEQQLKEIEHLKMELLDQKMKQMEIQQQSVTEEQKLNRSISFDEASSQTEEKYKRAVLKIKQLKDECEELKGKIDDLSEELAKVNFKLKEGERELLKTKDCNQLLQVDLQSSEKEKEKLSAQLQRLTDNMEEVKRENQELGSRLSEQETLQNSPDDNLKAQLQTLVKQLQDTQAKLVAEKHVCINLARKADFMEQEQKEVRNQLENINTSYMQEQQKASKYQMQLIEARAGIEEKEIIIEEKEHMIKLVAHEKEELAKENQSLKSNIEELRTICTSLHEVQQADSPIMQPDGTAAAGNISASHVWREQETPEDTENLYEIIGGRAEPEEEQLLVCQHCQVTFPGITRIELEQHEQSHRVCPFCTMICDNMEQSVFEDHVYSHEV
ncbi:Tax1-binding protein 1 -like protein B [Channa argus]|uniref:Tax1-binding protein 1-like protein B n=1 Tax=Channa argus TaxID=215402 RepID=A0A6G1QN55_CHAAH|nr:Tax1-binding protein 1 -like protein B [Channa argus]